jgi:hypothetical protein
LGRSVLVENNDDLLHGQDSDVPIDHESPVYILVQEKLELAEIVLWYCVSFLHSLWVINLELEKGCILALNLAKVIVIWALFEMGPPVLGIALYIIYTLFTFLIPRAEAVGSSIAGEAVIHLITIKELTLKVSG